MGRDFLSEIVVHKKETVAAARSRISEDRLIEDGMKRDAKRSFLDAMRKKDGEATVNIIAEIERASPSKGNIRIDLDPAVLAAQYETGGAAALSVLTETDYFKGSLDDFQKVRKAAVLPMLRKDFIISTYQIYESKAMCADAVLLIARILSPSQLKDYLALSTELDLDALVEINSMEDLESANAAGAVLIGINNRNLASFDTDIETAMRFSAMMGPDQIPVAASGISKKEDILRNRRAGIYNFLIGESLVRAENPSEFLQSLKTAKME